jgi:hypothetical protein
MKNKMGILMGVLLLLLVGTGFIVYKVLVPSKAAPQATKEEDVVETLPPADASIKVDVSKSKAKDNTVVMNVSGLGGKVVSVAYELTYDSEGLIKGVNSGSKPIETDGKDSFEREIYLGTCSRNVCKPDAGVKKVSVVMEFTDKAGKKSQFTKDYDF